jgi:hypothetical protein
MQITINDQELTDLIKSTVAGMLSQGILEVYVGDPAPEVTSPPSPLPPSMLIFREGIRQNGEPVLLIPQSEVAFIAPYDSDNGSIENKVDEIADRVNRLTGASE